MTYIYIYVTSDYSHHHPPQVDTVRAVRGAMATAAMARDPNVEAADFRGKKNRGCTMKHWFPLMGHQQIHLFWYVFVLNGVPIDVESIQWGFLRVNGTNGWDIDHRPTVSQLITKAMFPWTATRMVAESKTPA